MAVTAGAVLTIARAQIGYREGTNNDTKFGSWYGLNFNAWCAMFVSWVAANAKATDIIPKHAWTPAGAQWFKARDQWGHTPRVGAIVYFEWPGVGRISHVGIVEAVHADGSVTTIEGNTNTSGSPQGNGVYRMRRKANIAGYGYPKYVKPPVRLPLPGRPKVDLSELVKAARHDAARKQGGTTAGSKDDVIVVERALDALNLLPPKYAKDGSFGSSAVDAYSSWQRRLGFRGRDANGIPGMTSLVALGKKCGFDVKR